MITITVETDEEERAVRAKHEAGELRFGACPFVIRRGHRSIGGAGQTNTVVYAGHGWPDFMMSGGGGASTGSEDGGATGGPGHSYMTAGACATCGRPVPGGGHTDECTGLVPGTEYRIAGGGNGAVGA